jgi:aminoglycoside 2'-N-acetyltransferase I
MATGIRRVTTDQLSPSERGELRALFDEAWHGDEGFDDDDWAHTLGGTHFLMEVGGTVRSHVSVVPRTLVTGGRTLLTGYVEAVATWERDRRHGYASELIRVATDFIDERYELGALGTDLFDFYARFDWERWRGPTSVRTADGEAATPQEDGFVMVHRTPSTPSELDLDAPISCDWRPGDAW